MKVVSTEALTKLIQLVKSTFIKVDDVVEVSEIDLATVATSGSYNDLTNKPTAGTGIDVTNNVISVTSPTLVNTATGQYSLTINGKSTSQRRAYNIGTNSSSLAYGVAYGDGAKAGEFGVSIGYTSDCNTYGVALGYNAQSTLGSIQIGYGTNSQSMTMAVGFYNGTNSYEYQLLDGTTGLIPDARISSNIARTSNIPSATSDLNNDSGFITSSALSGYALDADVVHKSGNETIEGTKTIKVTAPNITQPQYLNVMPILLHQYDVANINNSVHAYYSIVQDKNGVFSIYNTSQINTTDVRNVINARTRNNDNTANISASLSIIAQRSGTTYATAPASDINGSIVTTVNKSKAANGYFQLGNGLIIQWGRFNSNSVGEKTITLPKAFTSANYSVTVQQGGASMGAPYYANSHLAYPANTTTFKVYTTYSESSNLYWIAIGY